MHQQADLKIYSHRWHSKGTPVSNCSHLPTQGGNSQHIEVHKSTHYQIGNFTRKTTVILIFHQKSNFEEISHTHKTCFLPLFSRTDHKRSKILKNDYYVDCLSFMPNKAKISLLHNFQLFWPYLAWNLRNQLALAQTRKHNMKDENEC